LETVACAVCTFGSDEWKLLGDKAFESLSNQSRQPDEKIRVHGDSLRLARNNAVEQCQTTHCIFLDADDLLDIQYVESMVNGTGDIRYPSVQTIFPNFTGEPALPNYRPLIDGNFIVIGAMFKKEDFLRVGGFGAEPYWEDWIFWIKMWLDELSIEPCPEAIYKYHFGNSGRNDRPAEELAVMQNKINQFYTPIAKAKGLI
jgi:hypothetical protein